MMKIRAAACPSEVPRAVRTFSNPRRALRFGLGGALFLGSLVEAKGGRLPAYEERIFRDVNEASDRLRIPVRAIMQAGTFATVPAVSAVALLAGRRRLAASLLVSGTVAWLGAKAAKPLAGRARPEAALGDVRVREEITGDLGWVSGHMAVATTLACVGSEAVPRWARPVLVAVAAITGAGRMYVGAHLPHDVVGGAGLGMMVSALVPPQE
jgi:glycosyltransferase 2 family protein